MSKITSVWDFDLLWSKCKLYNQKALNESRESPMFAFWCALALEFLGRATLAKVHPVLLADPRDGDNILYVFGYSKTEGPAKSIAAKTVFDRCHKVVPDFTKKELEGCLRLIEKRNEELHSGQAAFAEYHSKLWLADYYKACKVLLAFLGLGLKELIGEAEEKGAEEMIKVVDSDILKDVNKRISGIKNDFSKLPKADQESKTKHGIVKAHENFVLGCKIENCVCCSSEGLISGKIITVSEEKLEGGEIVYERVILPTSYLCYSCGLKLTSHQELKIAGYGGQFTDKVTWDPIEFFEIDSREVNLDDYYDYGND